MKLRGSMLKIAQISDLHCGEIRFDKNVLKYFIGEINKAKPDLLVVAGDLTGSGYREEFLEAKKYIDQIKCSKKMIVAGNHDCQNVGYEHFEDIFGPRFGDFTFCEEESGCDQPVYIMSVDSNRPDNDDGEVGRDKYKYIDSFFQDKQGLKIFVMHHHLVSIPGTGRERNVVYDAGDLLKKIDDLNIDVVLSGHKHVPHIWNLNNVKLISSGTAGTQRTRGKNLPSINFVEIDRTHLVITTLYSDKRRAVTRFLTQSEPALCMV
jgi:3',5'-cyclic-AMP phosphodiesterase